MGKQEQVVAGGGCRRIVIHNVLVLLLSRFLLGPTTAEFFGADDPHGQTQ